MIPPLGLSRVVIEQDNQSSGSWYVRVVEGGHITVVAPAVYLPAVSTEEGLQDTLRLAWVEMVSARGLV
jgi:MOSC domain-containing protein YiiM